MYGHGTEGDMRPCGVSWACMCVLGGALLSESSWRGQTPLPRANHLLTQTRLWGLPSAATQSALLLLTGRRIYFQAL